MLRIASLSLLLTATLAACTDPDPYMAISDAPGGIDEPRDEFAWSISTGSTGFYPPGTLELPQVVTLRVEGRQTDGEHDVNDPLAAAAIELIDGSACRITAPLRCVGGICFAELELTQVGLCMVRAEGATADGSAIDTCWYRGTWEQVPDDAGFMDRMNAMADAAHEDCFDR